MRWLNNWTTTAAVLSIATTTYLLIGANAPSSVRPYLALFGILFAIYLYLNPKRRYFRLGACALFALLSPLTMSGFIALDLVDVGSFSAMSTEPGAAYYFSLGLVAAICFTFDYLLNAESYARFAVRGLNVLSHWHINIGRNAIQTTISGNSGPVTINTGVHHWPSSDALHAEITSAADKTQKGMPDLAIELLTALLTRTSAEDRRARFRIHANLGYAHLEQNDVHSAKTEFMRSIEYESNTNESAGIEAFAYFISDDDSRALASAESALRLFPTCTQALSVLIQTAPLNRLPADFSNIVPPSLNDDVEVLNARSRREERAGNFFDAIALMRRALKKVPDSLRLLESLASLIRSEQAELYRLHHVAGGSPPNRIALDEAIGLYDSLLGKSKHLTKITLARIHDRLGLCHWILKDEKTADKHFSASLALVPNSADTRRHYVQTLLQRRDFATAIDNLKLLPTEEVTPDDRLSLAMALHVTADIENVRQAFAILRDNLVDISNLAPDSQIEWLSLLCQCAIGSGNSEWLKRESQKLPILSTHSWIESAIRAELVIADTTSSEAEAAATILHQLVDRFSANESPRAWMWAIRLCRIAKQWDLCLRAWKPIAIASPAWPFWHEVLDCGLRCSDDAFVLSYCNQLRLAGCLDAHCLHAELDTLAKHHDDLRAIELISGVLGSIQDDRLKRLLRLRRSVFALRSVRPDLVETQEDALPEVDTVEEQAGVWAVEVLRHSDLRERAVIYSYALLRRFPQSPEVNRQFVAAFDITGADIRTTSDVILLNDAVQYKENDTAAVHWVVLEDSEAADRTKDEVAPSHYLSKLLLGKSKGDSFVFREDDIQPRTATILDVQSKYAYRAFSIMESWETRFHETHFVKKFISDTRPDGTPDISKMLKTMEAFAADDELRRQAYINSPLGICLYAKLCHLTPIQATYIIGQDVKMPNRCVFGTHEEFVAAIQAISPETSFVIDPSAAATLFVCDLYEHLPAGSTKLLMTLSTKMSIHDELNRVTSKHKPSGYVQPVNGRIQFVDHDDEAYARYADRLQKYVDWIDKNVSIRGGTDVAQLARDTREKLESMFGAAYLESACLAKAENAMHWTDDVTVAQVLDRDLGVERTWTQACFFALIDQKSIPESVRQKATVELLRFGLESTFWNSHIAIAAGKASDWNVDRRPLREIVGFFERAEPIHAARIALEICVLAQKETIYSSPMEDVLTAIMRRIGGRNDGEFVASVIIAALPPAFGIDVVSAIKIRDLVVSALKTAKRPTLFLP